MKVFLSWSGPVSHKVACALRDWLPSVIQSIDPYVSSEDIDKGARWSTDIAAELDESNFGVLCLTPDNLNAPWLNFEAGSLAKALDKARVCPFLFRVKRAEVDGPLLQFQSTVFEADDVKKLLGTMNKHAEDSEHLEQERVDSAFDVWWPRLESSLGSIKPEGPDQKGGRRAAKDTSESLSSKMIEEILELVRSQHRLLNDPSDLLPPAYLRGALGREGRGAEVFNHPAWRDLIHAHERLSEVLHAGPAGSSVEEYLSVLRVVSDPLDYVINRFVRRMRDSE